MAGGGLIRDHQGSWVVGFYHRMGPLDSLEAELWALRDGLQLAVTMQLKALQVKMEAVTAIQLLHGVQSTRHQYKNLLHDCMYLMKLLQVK